MEKLLYLSVPLKVGMIKNYPQIDVEIIKLNKESIYLRNSVYVYWSSDSHTPSSYYFMFLDKLVSVRMLDVRVVVNLGPCWSTRNEAESSLTLYVKKSSGKTHVNG